MLSVSIAALFDIVIALIKPIVIERLDFKPLDPAGVNFPDDYKCWQADQSFFHTPWEKSISKARSTMVTLRHFRRTLEAT